MWEGELDLVYFRGSYQESFLTPYSTHSLIIPPSGPYNSSTPCMPSPQPYCSQQGLLAAYTSLHALRRPPLLPGSGDPLRPR